MHCLPSARCACVHACCCRYADAIFGVLTLQAEQVRGGWGWGVGGWGVGVGGLVLTLPAEQQRELSAKAQERAAAFGNQKFCDAFHKALVYGNILEAPPLPPPLPPQ